MSEHHYEARLERDLADIKARLARLAGLVASAIRNSVEALEHHNRALAYQTILDDNPINREVEACDRACHHFVARHLPTAGHLRFISSVMRLNIALERVGDYAATICRVTVQLTEPLDEDMLERTRVIAVGSTEMFEQAIESFIEGNAELARGTMALEGQIDRSFRAALDHILAESSANSVAPGDLLGRLVILSTLERIGDQAKNICEYAVFAQTGETKQRKPVPVLFVDRDNSVLGPVAVAIARKGFPDHGEYSTAGLSVSDAVDERVDAQMAELGHELGSIPRASLEDLVPDIRGKKVVVALEGRLDDYLDEVPFNTVFVTWDLPPKDGDFRELYGALNSRIRELMTTLRGEQP